MLSSERIDMELKICWWIMFLNWILKCFYYYCNAYCVSVCTHCGRKDQLNMNACVNCCGKSTNSWKIGILIKAFYWFPYLQFKRGGTLIQNGAEVPLNLALKRLLSSLKKIFFFYSPIHVFKLKLILITI